MTTTTATTSPATPPRLDPAVEQAARVRIQRCRIRLLAGMPFFGSLAMRLTFRFSFRDPRVPTACVYPRGLIVIDLDFMASLSDAELLGLLCHELLHVAFGCWVRQGPRTARLITTDGCTISAWNVAHDYAINPTIAELSPNYPWIVLPPGGLLDLKYKGRSAEDIYDDVVKNAKVINAPGWGEDLGEGDNADVTREDAEGWRTAVFQAAQTHIGSGRALPEGIEGLLAQLRAPKVDWRNQIAQWVGDAVGRVDYSYRRPARRAEAVGEILCGVDSSGLPAVIVLWDVSGSMNELEALVFGEVAGILEATKAPIRVIFCDTEIQADIAGTRDAAQIAASVVRGGGSDFMPAFRLIEGLRPAPVVIAITDGYILVPAEMPSVQAVLWTLLPGGVDPTRGAWGHVIHVEAESA